MQQGPRCHEGGITGWGNPTHGVLVLGVAPGKDEMRLGRPMVGPNGKMFNDLTRAVGFPRDNMYVTNMCCTHIPGTIKQEDLDACFKRLDGEIKRMAPKLILLLGAEVARYWMGKTMIQARGAVTWSPQYQCYVMATIQPAALFHDDSLNSNAQTDRVSNNGYDIVRDLRKIPEILEWPTDGSKNHVPYSIIQSHEECQQILTTLPRDRPVAVDIETNAGFVDMIDVARDDIVCMAISDGTNTWVGIKEHFVGCEWPDDVQYTFHYSQFDTAVIYRQLGVWLQVHHDTLLKSYSCDERPGYHSLKPLAREFEAAGFYEEKRAIGLEELLEYNAKDAAYTARLCTGKLDQWQREEGTQGMYTSLLIPAVNVFKEVKARGARVDLNLLRELERDWGDEKYQELARLQAMAHNDGWPEPDINLNSWQQVGKLLYGVLSLPDACGRCKGKQPSTNKEHLEGLRGQHPFVDSLLEYRHLEHNHGIYIDGWVNHIRPAELGHGRIHPDINLHGTATGRRSYGKPAVQTIPRPSNQANKYGRLRQAIIPTSDDYEIAYAVKISARL